MPDDVGNLDSQCRRLESMGVGCRCEDSAGGVCSLGRRENDRRLFPSYFHQNSIAYAATHVRSRYGVDVRATGPPSQRDIGKNPSDSGACLLALTKR